MLKLLSRLDRGVFTPRVYFLADTDQFSLTRLEQFEAGRTFWIIRIPSVLRVAGARGELIIKRKENAVRKGYNDERLKGQVGKKAKGSSGKLLNI